MTQTRVLVIEDDIRLGRLLTEALSRAGFEAEFSVDGEKGLQAFMARRHQVVVTDIIMPEREGLETLKAIKAEAPDAKIVAMSGGGRIGPDAFLQLAERLGADATVTKPFRPSELAAIVRRLAEPAPAPA